MKMSLFFLKAKFSSMSKARKNKKNVLIWIILKFSAEIKLLSMILMFKKNLQKSKYNICPWRLCLGDKGKVMKKSGMTHWVYKIFILVKN